MYYHLHTVYEQSDFQSSLKSVREITHTFILATLYLLAPHKNEWSKRYCFNLIYNGRFTH